MFHDILFALLGLSGDIVVVGEDPIIGVPTFRIKDGFSLINDAEKEQINSILPLGWYYQQFQLFMNQYNLSWNLTNAHSPLYKLSLSLAIQDLLQEYEATVTELEELYNRNLASSTEMNNDTDNKVVVISYNTLIIYLKNYSMIFPQLYQMLLNIEQQAIHGCSIIDFFASQEVGNPVLKEVIDR